MTQLNKLYSQWLDVQPLSADDEQRLNRKFMLDFNYNSNHIEGNTLTYGQTEVLLLLGEWTHNTHTHTEFIYVELPFFYQIFALI